MKLAPPPQYLFMLLMTCAHLHTIHTPCKDHINVPCGLHGCYACVNSLWECWFPVEPKFYKPTFYIECSCYVYPWLSLSSLLISYPDTKPVIWIEITPTLPCHKLFQHCCQIPGACGPGIWSTLKGTCIFHFRMLHWSWMKELTKKRKKLSWRLIYFPEVPAI